MPGVRTDARAVAAEDHGVEYYRNNYGRVFEFARLLEGYYRQLNDEVKKLQEQAILREIKYKETMLQMLKTTAEKETLEKFWQQERCENENLYGQIQGVQA